jgi:hypothetical protein
MISSLPSPAIGASSVSNNPSLVARAAFSWLPAENSSSSPRDRVHRAVISSALIPCGTRPSEYRWANPTPNGSLPGRTDDPIGTRLIDSTPAAITMS